jgi:hypothetical protein
VAHCRRPEQVFCHNGEKAAPPRGSPLVVSISAILDVAWALVSDRDAGQGETSAGKGEQRGDFVKPCPGDRDRDSGEEVKEARGACGREALEGDGPKGIGEHGGHDSEIGRVQDRV